MNTNSTDLPDSNLFKKITIEKLNDLDESLKLISDISRDNSNNFSEKLDKLINLKNDIKEKLLKIQNNLDTLIEEHTTDRKKLAEISKEL